jgi:hypothetical protein
MCAIYPLFTRKFAAPFAKAARQEAEGRHQAEWPSDSEAENSPYRLSIYRLINDKHGSRHEGEIGVVNQVDFLPPQPERASMEMSQELGRERGADGKIAMEWKGRWLGSTGGKWI